jgi:hypothetical protein
VSNEKNNPVYDEQLLGKLLEAAYVMQEHNRERQKRELNLELNREFQQAETKRSKALGETLPKKLVTATEETTDASSDIQTLAPIVEAQHQIQARHLDLENAMDLVAERTVSITRAGGAAVLLMDGENVIYRAASGAHAPVLGTRVAVHKALSCSSLRTGEVVRCIDVTVGLLLDGEECKQREIASLITAPIYHDGKIAGALEVYFAKANAFAEPQVHASQLMAGLVSEAIARDTQLSLKKSLAAERASMLDALEKLQPNLAALAETSLASDLLLKESMAAERTSSDRSTADRSAINSSITDQKNQSINPSNSVSAQTCRKCGHELVAEEQFCGKCGSPRSGDYEPPSMQSKVATLWLMQQVNQDNTVPINGTAIARAAAAPQGSAPIDITKAELPKAQISKAETEKAGIVRKDSLNKDLFNKDSSEDELPAAFPLQNFTLEDLGLPEMKLFDGRGGFNLPSATTENITKPGNDEWKAGHLQHLQKDILHANDEAFEDNLEEDHIEAADLHKLNLDKLDLRKFDLSNIELCAVGSHPLDSPESGPDQISSHLSDSVQTDFHSEDAALTEENAEELPATEVALTSSDTRPTWSSAANAREFFEQLAGDKDRNSLAHFWNARRGDIYLALAVVLVAGVIRWGIWSNHSVSATGHSVSAANTTPTNAHPQTEANADLSAFDKILISLGLAEAPQPPEYKGNPDIQVWIDTQSALYYCPSDDLYGKTPKGKYTSQRDAQLDQFEPALRKMCD